MDDDVELRLLRERVYGLGGDSATADTIARLSELEERARAGTAPDAPATEVRTADGADATPPRPVEDEAEHVRVRPAARWALGVIAAIALVGVGIAIGSALAVPPSTAATPDPATLSLPELAFPQTVEDVISADILRDSGIDPASTRYIATVSDFRIYLAQPDDGDGRCIATFTSTDNDPWSAGCASGAQEDAAVFGIDDTLTVAIGDPLPSAVDGIPIRLSDSVTALVAR